MGWNGSIMSSDWINALLGMTVGIVVIATSVLAIVSGAGPFLGALAICMGALAFSASVMGYISALSERARRNDASRP
jgi:hypothetical protein